MESGDDINEQLISEVHKCKHLWDLKDKEYRNAQKKKKSWEEISNIVKFDIHKCQKRWNGLRDVRRQLKKKQIMQGRSGSSASKPIKWPYFDLMNFLDDRAERRKTESNVGSLTEKSDTNDIESDILAPVNRDNEEGERECEEQSEGVVTETENEKQREGQRQKEARKNLSARTDAAILQYLQQRDQRAALDDDEDLLFGKYSQLFFMPVAMNVLKNISSFQPEA